MGKIYYKVLTQELKSVISRNGPLEDRFITENLIIQYKINEWIKPKIKYTKLMVFDNLDDAKYFTRGTQLIIYECKIKNPSKNGPFAIFYHNLASTVMQYIKIAKNKKKLPKTSTSIPPGTVFCSAVKLIGRA